MTIKNNVILNKVATVEKCLRRVKEKYSGEPRDLEYVDNVDIIVLNLQRACQAVIDLANHVCASKKLGIPQDSADIFNILSQNNIIDKMAAERMGKMVGFRNVAVHDYQELNLKILLSILDHHLTDFTDFTSQVIKSIKL